ncbi:MAG: RDD family protein [Acidimicrobiales bacterium]
MATDDHPDPPEPDDTWSDEAPADGAEWEIDEIPESGPGSLAPIWARGIARVVDLFIIGLAGSLVAQVFGLIEVVDDEVVSQNPTLVILVLLVVWALYEVTGTASGGRTVGKLMLGLRIRSAEVDQAPPPSKSLVRWLLPAIALLLPIAGLQLVVLLVVYFSAVANPRYQGFHDRVAHTLVVRNR